MAEKFRVAIIGTGSIAHAHARSYLKMDDVEIVAGSDIVPGRARAFLDEFGLKDAVAYEDTQKMLDEVDLDGVSVCTYNQQHVCCAVAAEGSSPSEHRYKNLNSRNRF